MQVSMVHILEQLTAIAKMWTSLMGFTAFPICILHFFLAYFLADFQIWLNALPVLGHHKCSFWNTVIWSRGGEVF